jgi:transglutaminase-like putative cysteine protease
MGTTCNLIWREAPGGERERIWAVEPGHPIAAGLGPYFEIPREEMYGERFDIPAPDKLPATMRWRTFHLIRYENGKWLKDPLTGSVHVTERIESARSLLGPRPPSHTWRQRLPELGPNPYLLTFRVSRKIGLTPVLADPILWRPRFPSPVVSEGRDGLIAWQQMPDGTFTLHYANPSLPRQMLAGPYHQAAADAPEPGLGPPMRLNGRYTEFLTRTPNNMPNLRGWTANLLDRLAGQGELSAEARSEVDPFTGNPARRHHEPIARALEKYLAGSSEFAYSLDLSRVDRKIDPVEDFLFNVRAGHCERFATALVMMLRTQGIPAQLILGFRGQEPRGDGWHEIRQDHAHAWVEVLIPRPPHSVWLGSLIGGPGVALGPKVEAVRPLSCAAGGLAVQPLNEATPGDPQTPGVYHWLSLDPTPGYSGDDPGLLENLFGSGSRGEALFEDFILGYNAQAREKAIGAVVDWFERQGDEIAAGNVPVAAWAVLGVVGLPIVVRRFARRRRRRRDEAACEAEAGRLARVAPFHARLLAVLARHGFVPRPSQTAREFAAAVSERLALVPATADVARVPLDAAAFYYRVRFGRDALGEADRQALDDGLNRLEQALGSVSTQRAVA